LVSTRRGSAASARSSANSFAASSIGRAPTRTSRVAGLIASSPILHGPSLRPSRREDARDPCGQLGIVHGLGRALLVRPHPGGSRDRVARADNAPRAATGGSPPGHGKAPSALDWDRDAGCVRRHKRAKPRPPISRADLGAPRAVPRPAGAPLELRRESISARFALDPLPYVCNAMRDVFGEYRGGAFFSSGAPHRPPDISVFALGAGPTPDRSGMQCPNWPEE
jgi:hypothetical protein